MIALRGDEQLALAAQSCRDTIAITEAEIEGAGDSSSGALISVVRNGGEEINLLDVGQLFATAMRQRERRRRRF